MDKVKWGIIGCGNVTELKSGPAFSKVKNSELIACMRRNASAASAAKDYALRHNVPHWYHNGTEQINSSYINFIKV